MVLICQWLGANMAVLKAVLAILFLLLMTLVSLVFLTAALLCADLARYNSAAALLMNVD